MFKVSAVTSSSLKEAHDILSRVYEENPKHWPNGLTPFHFDGGLYLVREKQSNTAVGFCGWQERLEKPDNKTASLIPRRIKIGYYSIGILPEYRQNGFAKSALSKLIAMKSARVDQVRALVVSSNVPSIHLARSLGVDAHIKQAYQKQLFRQASLLQCS